MQSIGFIQDFKTGQAKIINSELCLDNPHETKNCYDTHMSGTNR